MQPATTTNIDIPISPRSPTAAPAGRGGASPAPGPVDPASVAATPGERVRKRLNIYFAIATCLAASTLAGNPATEMLPVIACAFAIFGLTFVDLLRWFSLPPPAAYVALGAIALYSIGQFVEYGFGIADDQQMVVVAELLVLVQAVLMLQQKNRRIYEQLAIFCLLELIVAAIFNDALSYGLLLFPLGVVGAGALALLQTYQTADEAFAEAGEGASGPTGGAMLRTWTVRSADSFHRAGLVLPRLTLTVLTPAVLLIALLFFYGLPRTSTASKAPSGGKVLVGFSETVRLGQIGRMLENDDPAARIELIERQTRRPYYVSGGLYLRGAVLESYNLARADEGTWSATENMPRMGLQQLPPSPVNHGEEMDADDLLARITIEPTNSAALFSLPPYHRLATGPEVTHQRDRWLLSRRRGFGSMSSGQLPYQFATTAFRHGQQTRFLPRYPRLPQPLASADSAMRAKREAEFAQQRQQDRIAAANYDQLCLQYDDYRVPSAGRLSDAVLASESPRSENPLEIATKLEQFLIAQGGYRYTLDLTGETVPGLDPIEQFLSIDRQGNCQYFASALVLMLRSQGIPARLVVGFNTDEFNSIGGFYIARQLHAHAWVEALIDAQWIDPEERMDGGDENDQYWVRFDPTPGGGGVDRVIGGRVSEVFGLAQSMWIDYVVQRNAASRRGDGLSGGGSAAITSQYHLVFLWLDLKLSQIRAGQLGGGALAVGRRFSWAAAALGVVLTLMVLVVAQLRWPKRWRWAVSSAAGASVSATPQVPFFAETLRLLQRVGIRRSIGQTPLEVTTQAAGALEQPGVASMDQPLRLLTDAFYDTRFGGAAGSDVSSSEPTDPEVMAALQSVRSRVEMIEARSRRQPT